jgi:hypothetical protein
MFHTECTLFCIPDDRTAGCLGSSRGCLLSDCTIISSLFGTVTVIVLYSVVCSLSPLSFSCILPWWWGQQVSPNRSYVSAKLHGVTCQKDINLDTEGRHKPKCLIYNLLRCIVISENDTASLSCSACCRPNERIRWHGCRPTSVARMEVA